MAPNRHSASDVIRFLSFEGFREAFVTESKHAPLTSEPLQGDIELHDNHEASSSATAPQHIENYWDEAAAESKVQAERRRRGGAVGHDENPETHRSRSSLVEGQDAAAVEDGEAEECSQARGREEWEAEVERRKAVVANIAEEEKARSLVSTAGIVANLKSDAAKTRDDAEPTEVVSQGGARGEKGYWTWDAKVDAEREEAAFASARTEGLVKKEAATTSIQSHSPEESNEPEGIYWDWDAEMTKEEAAKQRLIAKILEDERARLVVSASRIETNLKNDAKTARPPSSSDVRRSGVDSEDYWYHPFSAPPSEDVIVKAPHASDPTHPRNKYWDWSPPLSPKDARQGVIDRIMADDEARRALSAARTQEVMERESERHAAMERERWGDLGMGMGAEDGFWGM